MDESSDSSHDDPPQTLAEELGIGDSLDPVFSSRGRLFSTAGPESPVAEFTEEHLILYPPQKPMVEDTFAEEISIHANREGVLLNELGEPRKIPKTYFRGHELVCLIERSPVSGKYLVAWFDEKSTPHRLFFQGVELSIPVAFRLRNATHDGELSIFPDLTTDEKRTN